MIHYTFEFLKNHLTKLPVSPDLVNSPMVFNGININNKYLPKNETPAASENELYITLLNIEEERSNKDPNRYKRIPVLDGSKPDSFSEFNPQVILNLYIMFSGFSSEYEESLKSISKVITAFANKNVFDRKDISDAGIPDSGLNKIILDLHNISLEQNNSLWQAMATNILPHVIYKVRAVTIIPDRPIASATEVTEISINAWN